MSISERIYSVLAVSSSEQVNSALSALLPAKRFDPVRFVPSGSAARRALLECPFDLVIINSPLQDDPGVRLAIDTVHTRGAVVLLITRSEFYEDLLPLTEEQGVFLLRRPLSRTLLETAIGWMTAMRERLRLMEKRTLSVEEKMEEIRLVNRAKWALIRARNMDEASAHRYIEKQAMDRGLTRRAVAEEILLKETSA